MLIVICWVLVAIVGIAGTVASFNSVRFNRRVALETRKVAAGALEPAPRAPGDVDLPPPVARYINKAISRAEPIRTVSLSHGGRFRTSLSGSWLPIRGSQFFRTSPPAFIWWGRVRIAPGLWVDARDRSVDGTGNMLVRVESTVTVANSSGPQLDQGALLRLLGEMTWMPTALLDRRYVRWSAIDDHRASATLSINGHEVTGVFEFGGDDLPMSFTAERYRDIGGGQSVLTPFIGRSSDYRLVSGVLVPFRVVGAWVVENKPIEYADFVVEELAFDRRLPL
jgi:uncharacterized protein DUF6544